MSATKLFLNNVLVSFTPSGGSASPLTKITNVAIDGGIDNVSFKGDNDLFYTYKGNVNQDPTVTLQGGYVSALLASAAGVIGTLTGTVPDAKNGYTTGSFALQWTLSNAILDSKSSSHPHGQLASGSNMFSAYSTDGATSPLVYTIL